MVDNVVGEQDDEKESIAIGKPVTELPLSAQGNGKYAEVWATVDKLKSGEWLPVKVGTLRQRQRLAEIAKHRNCTARCRKLVVYLSKNPQDKQERS